MRDILNVIGLVLCLGLGYVVIEFLFPEKEDITPEYLERCVDQSENEAELKACLGAKD